MAHRTGLLWAVRQIVVVTPYRSFGRTYWSHLQGLRNQGLLKSDITAIIQFAILKVKEGKDIRVRKVIRTDLCH
jgi:hypothetical protein